MKIKDAIEILERHNKWRRGSNTTQIDPTVLGIAIDIILNYIKQKNYENKSN